MNIEDNDLRRAFCIKEKDDSNTQNLTNAEQWRRTLGSDRNMGPPPLSRASTPNAPSHLSKDEIPSPSSLDETRGVTVESTRKSLASWSLRNSTTSLERGNKSAPIEGFLRSALDLDASEKRSGKGSSRRIDSTRSHDSFRTAKSHDEEEDGVELPEMSSRS